MKYFGNFIVENLFTLLLIILLIIIIGYFFKKYNHKKLYGNVVIRLIEKDSCKSVLLSDEKLENICLFIDGKKEIINDPLSGDELKKISNFIIKLKQNEIEGFYKSKDIKKLIKLFPRITNNPIRIKLNRGKHEILMINCDGKISRKEIELEEIEFVELEVD